jgi:hypothetical protein
MKAVDAETLANFQHLLGSLNPELCESQFDFSFPETMTHFQENTVSLFFNRLDAILTCILSSSEKNSYFKPGQTYIDMCFKEFNLQALMNLTPSRHRC